MTAAAGHVSSKIQAAAAGIGTRRTVAGINSSVEATSRDASLFQMSGCRSDAVFGPTSSIGATGDSYGFSGILNVDR